MTWTLETKIIDRAPTKRGDEWTQDVCHIIRDERGRYIVSATEHETPGLAGVTLSSAELQAAVRLIAAAPDMYRALEAIAQTDVDALMPREGVLYLRAMKLAALVALMKARGEA